MTGNSVEQWARKNSRILLIVVVALCLLPPLFLIRADSGFRSRLLSPHETTPIQQKHDATTSQDEVKDSDFYTWNTTSYFSPIRLEDSEASLEDLCNTFPRRALEHVQPVLKTGHGESRDKLEGQLSSVSACLSPSLLIFSDLSSTIDGLEVIDILADLPPSYAHDNPIWQEYIRQKELATQGQLTEDVHIDGWALDKFKFLPMVERTWKLRPGRKWYVFYEPDTYVSWDNMFRFLDHFDPDLPLYFGSPSPGREGTWFAHGGTGYVLSRAAVKQLLHRRTLWGRYVQEPVSERWLQLLREDCCGDSVLGWALHNAGVDLSGFWPMFNPHHLVGLPFSEHYWCQPLLTLHKTDPAKMKKFWRWEQSRRQADHPLLYRDIFFYLFSTIEATAIDWMNSDWDSYRAPDNRNAHSSFEACGKACARNDECFQYNYHHDSCTFVKSIRLGYHKGAEGDDGMSAEGKRYMAGWDAPSIEEWTSERRCETALWVQPSIERKY